MSAGGDCYEAAAQLVLRLGAGARLAHGEATGRGEIAGTRFGHAWVEINGAAIDPSNGGALCAGREEYYALGEIDAAAVRRYSRREALERMLASSHYGPWEEAAP